jgi:hypothetical protein
MPAPHHQGDRQGAPSGVRRPYRFAAYNLVAVVVCVVLAGTRAWWFALVALAPAGAAVMWFMVARRVAQRESL